MDSYERHQRIWRMLYALSHRWICRKFNLQPTELDVEGPVLLIPNHVSAWDPLLVAMSLRRKQVYYVASEHLFRLGLVTQLIQWLVAPIPRRKASTGTDTVKACLRHLRAGHSVCLFAEGEQCWDGRSQDIFPATGKLAKSSGATLVTFRLEGGYLSLPRWGRGIRRGRVRGYPVGIYSPEQLKAMSPGEIDDLINRDLYEDAWQRQAEDPVAFRGRRRAEGLEKALYLCPGCRRIGSLRSKGDRLFCDCGLDLTYTETGFFQPRQPFAHIAAWEDWQRQELRAMPFPADGPLFADEGILLSRVGVDHRSTLLTRGTLEQYADALVCDAYRFPLKEISSMAPVQSHLLLLSHQGSYYELHAPGGANLRKYLEIWKNR